MTLISALIATAVETPRNIESVSSLIFDWDTATVIIKRSDIPNAGAFREQDDVIWDAKTYRYVFYVTVQFSGPRWETWVTYSTNGRTWSKPIQCVMNTGGPLLGQDPSVVTTLDVNPKLHRDINDVMWMYLENHPDPTNHSTHLYSSRDGITWTLEKEKVIPNGGDSEWDKLTGSPNARYVNGKYVVGYEGFGSSTGEMWGVATGTSPDNLTKSSANPLILGTDHGLSLSCFMDSWWLTEDQTMIMLTGHSGVNGSTYTPRFYTENTDPLTWIKGDFVLINDASDNTRNDVTCHRAIDRLVTSPNDDESVVAIALA